MFVIGITGGIGSGKSTVAGLLREAGLPVLDADKISHSVTQSQGSAIPEIREVFGSSYIKEDGALDRKMTADLVFHDKKALDRLSLIVHKHTLDQMATYLKELTASGEKVAVLDVPIPVKEGFLDRCDLVINVVADPEIRLERLLGRGLSQTDAERRMAIQMPPESYSDLADLDISNNGDFDQLRSDINQFMDQELGSRGLLFKKI